jgi:hypothetical protein
MRILVRTLTETTHVLDVQPSDTILQVKMQIADKEHIVPENQLLLYNRKKLDDHQTLTAYNIQNDTTIFLVLSP